MIVQIIFCLHFLLTSISFSGSLLLATTSSQTSPSRAKQKQKQVRINRRRSNFATELIQTDNLIVTQKCTIKNCHPLCLNHREGRKSACEDREVFAWRKVGPINPYILELCSRFGFGFGCSDFDTILVQMSSSRFLEDLVSPGP